jgi:hypothetical protein
MPVLWLSQKPLCERARHRSVGIRELAWRQYWGECDGLRSKLRTQPPRNVGNDAVWVTKIVTTSSDVISMVNSEAYKIEGSKQTYPSIQHPESG